MRRRAEASCTRIFTPSTPTSASPSCVRSASLGASRSPTLTSDHLPKRPRCSSTLPLREVTTAVARTCGSPGWSGPADLADVAVLAGARPQAASAQAHRSARPAHERTRIVSREYELDHECRKFHLVVGRATSATSSHSDRPRASCLAAHIRILVFVHSLGRAFHDALGSEARVAPVVRERRSTGSRDGGHAAFGEPRVALARCCRAWKRGPVGNPACGVLQGDYFTKEAPAAKYDPAAS